MKKISFENSVLLCEGKPLLTPFGRPLTLPNATLGDAVAQEWRAQGDKLRKETMPLTQIACIAIDMAAQKRPQLTEDMLAYSDTDLLCYRAGDIPELFAVQQEELDGVVEWAQSTLHIALHITDGIMPIAQPAGNKAKLTAHLESYDIWRLAALASVVKPLSSIAIALAFVERHIDAERAFRISHLEEIYETGKWGADEEKEQRLRKLKEDLLSAERFLAMLA